MKPIDSLDVIRAARAHFNGLSFESLDTGLQAEGHRRVALAGDLADDINARIAKRQSVDAVFSRVREAILAHAANAIDAAWYLERYADVSSAGIGAEQHYQLDGRKEGRFPNLLAEKIARLSEYFDGQWYLNRYGDVADARMDPSQHFVQHGRQEGRFPNKLVEKRRGLTEWFDGEWYLKRYLDVAQSGQDPRQHYVTYGATEGRYPNAAAENNSRLGADDFADFICRLIRKAFARNVDYFEYLAWMQFYRLGLTKEDIRRIALQ